MNSHGFNLGGKRVLVTGATGDIGSATCRVLVQQGGWVVATGRDRGRLETLQASGGAHEIIVADLRQSAQTTQLVHCIPLLDALVFASGTCMIKSLRTQSEDDFETILESNVTSAVSLTRKLLRANKIQNGCGLVYLSSIIASRGAIGYTGYATSKGAINAFVRSLAVELAKRHVRVNAVCPGMVQSRMARDVNRLSTAGLNEHWAQYPLGEGTVEDVAWAVCFLVSPASRWITGIDLTVDGGWCIR